MSEVPNPADVNVPENLDDVYSFTVPDLIENPEKVKMLLEQLKLDSERKNFEDKASKRTKTEKKDAGIIAQLMKEGIS